MTSRRYWLACIALSTLALPAASPADEMEAAEPQVQRELQAPAIDSAPASVITPETPGGWADPPGETAIEDWKSQNPWGYGTDYIFPLTRSVVAADLPLWVKIPVYPVTGLADLAQLPFGAIGGLWGS